MHYKNNNQTRKYGAPLWTWFVACALALAFIGFSYYGFSGTSFRTYYLDYFNAKRLEQFALPGEEKELKVAVIGTSLTQCAFYKDEDMDSFARDRGINIRFLRFTLSAGSLHEFYDIAEEVINSSADIIFFEAAIFELKLSTDTDIKRNLFHHRVSLRKTLIKTIFDLPLIPERLRSKVKMEGNNNIIDAKLNLIPKNEVNKSANHYRRIASGFRIREFSDGERFAPLFALARKQGKAVAFLDLSRSKEAWDLLPKTFKGEISKIMSRYEKDYGIPYIRFPYRLTLDYFRDFAHFNQAGRKFYSEWFLTNLVTLTEKPSP